MLKLNLDNKLLIQMSNRPLYDEQGVVITKTLLQKAVSQANNQIQRQDTITGVLQTMQLISQSKIDPTNPLVKMTLHQLSENNFKANNNTSGVLNRQSMYNLNNQKQFSLIQNDSVHTLNKSGTFSILERNCKIADKSIFEWEGKDDKNAKKKDIKNFRDKIQFFGEAGNNSLKWIANSQENPYRIILIDSHDHEKAIYFKSLQQAQNLRIHYLLLFKIKQSIPKIIEHINENNFKESFLQCFKRKLIAYNRGLNLKNSLKKVQPSYLGSSYLKSKYSGSGVEEQSRVEKIQSIGKNLDMSNRNSGVNIFNNNHKRPSLTNSPSKLRNPFLEGVFIALENEYKKDFALKIKQGVRRKKQQDRENSFKINKSNQNYSHNQAPKTNFMSHLQKQQSKQKLSRMNSQDNNSKLSLIPSEKQMKPFQNLSEGQSVIQFKGIQFLKQSNVLFKPIVTFQLIKANRVQKQTIYNTFLQRQHPHLQYKFLYTSGQQNFTLKGKQSFKNYDLNVIILNYLTNQQVLNEVIPLKNKIFSRNSTFFTQDKSIKIALDYLDKQLQKQQKLIMRKDSVYGQKIDEKNESKKVFLELDPINQQIVKKIKVYWEQQSTKKGYYSIDAQMKIFEILSIGSSTVDSWWLGLDQETYNVVSLLKTASNIIGFKLIKSSVYIIKALKNLYNEMQEIIQAIISIIVNCVPRLYFQDKFTQLTNLHRCLGLQESKFDLAGKIELELSAFEALINYQIPILMDKMKRRNICLKYSIYEYYYELYSRNLPIKVLVQVWNFIFKDVNNIEIYLFLLGVCLLKFLQVQLTQCRSLKELCSVLEQKKLPSSQLIIAQISKLRAKYFQHQGVGQINKNLVSGLKSFLSIENPNNPLQNVLFDFYRKQTQKIELKKVSRRFQNNIVLQKLIENTGSVIEIPSYPSKKYTFHIYFYQLPKIAGSLYLKTDDVEYECIDYQSKRYFIISDVNSKIVLQFIDNKTRRYTCQLTMIRGVNTYNDSLVQTIDNQQSNTGKSSRRLPIKYSCCLLTETQIQIFKKNKKFQHFLGPFMTVKQVSEQFLRPINQSIFLKSVNPHNDRDDTGKKIKILFSQGNKCFNEIDFYLHWIHNLPYNLKQKLMLVKQLAQKFSKQHFLCNNAKLEKHLLRKFVNLGEITLSNVEFQCFYNNSLECELDAPKILKVRYIPSQGIKQVKLQQQVIQYQANKNQKYFENDVIIDEIFQVCKSKIQSETGPIVQGNLHMLYSSNGQVFIKNFLISRKKHNNRQITIEQMNKETKYIQEIAMSKPQLLMTQILPTFTKISTILDYVHAGNNTTDLKKQRKQQKLAENINILKLCQQKSGRVILMRYYAYPQTLYIPFYSYFHQLNTKIKNPQVPYIFLNNAASDIKSVCISKMPLKFSQNKRGQTCILKRQWGLFTNIRKAISGSQSLFFWYFQKNAEEQDLQQCIVFVNYGYGIYRWQKAYVVGYYYKQKQRKNKPKKQNSKPKKQYLIYFKNEKLSVRDYQIRIHPAVEKKLKKLDFTLSDLAQQKASKIKQNDKFSKFVK